VSCRVFFRQFGGDGQQIKRVKRLASGHEDFFDGKLRRLTSDSLYAYEP